ncbi:putative mitochondrial protein [Vitis vinifera]|uniref:Putative mitochondrial protein n=1 Tax=Vitis vinifera TaxID=29760 RepID=A0A438J035_VITVI|nr:putative mitochondrial protein [Vitis vinifera]
MKDLGEVKVILGFKITRTPKGLKLSQEHYIEKILKKFEHFDCKLMSTPYDLSSQLKKNKEHSVAQTEHAQIIGSLMYLTNYTRLDIAYVVSRLSRGFPSVLEGFSDANWISDSDEMKSTNGYVFTLGEGVISLEFVRSELNLVYPLTKPLNKKLVEETLRGMGFMPIIEVKSGDKAYSALTKVKCLLLMNTIFLMNARSVVEKTNVDKGPLSYIKKHWFIEIYFHRVL